MPGDRRPRDHAATGWRGLGMARRGPDWAAWVRRPCRRCVGDLLEEWQLTTDGWMMHGFCALVVPVRTTSRQARGAQGGLPRRGVRARAPRAAALARSRRRTAAAGRPAPVGRCCSSACTRSDLTEVWDLEACEVVAGLYARLHVPAPPAAAAADVVRRALDRPSWPPSRATHRSRAGWSSRRCRCPATSSPTRPAPATMIHGDLHYENVLAGDRRAVAGDRPQADERRPALRAGADAVEPVDEDAGRADVRDGRPRAASTRSSTPPASTRTAPATGSWSGCCTTPAGRSRTTRADGRRPTTTT